MLAISKKAKRPKQAVSGRIYDSFRMGVEQPPEPDIVDDLVHSKPITRRDLDVFLAFLNVAAKSYHEWRLRIRPHPEIVDRVLASFASRLVSKPLPRNWVELLEAVEQMPEDSWDSRLKPRLTLVCH